MQAVIKSWLAFEGKTILVQKLSKFLADDGSRAPAGHNPFLSFLALIKTTKINNRKRRNDCVRDFTVALETHLNHSKIVGFEGENGGGGGVVSTEDWRHYLTTEVKERLLEHMIEGEFFRSEISQITVIALPNFKGYFRPHLP